MEIMLFILIIHMGLALAKEQILDYIVVALREMIIGAIAMTHTIKMVNI